MSECSQCKGCGQVADVPQIPKPSWTDWENRPRAGPSPMTDFVKPIPCPSCVKDSPEEPKPFGIIVAMTPAKSLRAKAVDYRAKADKLENLAKIADGLTEGSEGDLAFKELLKTQGVDL